ncbi:hypothetical protein ThrDRAFT_04617 [Frankia casuarinae]|uniref:maleylpyruvate isomerase N-terminal domain-containing protein n=1 Tax=Frankia TaxID=1854 RepID=UPI0003D0619C|nr:MULTISPECIES: maleylpyruvate isomerase N-terminal domain-containing protein [Frankia]ETA00348.1 hypothetical protein CcI6DRAFT_04230 [Frankia sp. CcI6]EYT89757.1 hypothetical protein ThrDRAFT_04617 [Frankia casuarinae]KDA40563.1 hypothetical protein BMG523Draft_04622 [Frankia sp. BMG5.23]KFB02620.1 hypothetical protein ALLO2DRAFT_04644 [Frankia sp. Allo2]OAA18399.1 hypothetical protein AAY23_11292 [Frankia casuarinae]
MHLVGADEVQQAVAEMVRVLAPHDEIDWHIPAGSLEWTCWTTAAHVVHDLAAYAVQLTAQSDEKYLPFDLTVRPGASPRQILRLARVCGCLLGAAVSGAAPEVRSWHWGATDPSGFAALGVCETLVHTYDITQGLEIAWSPPEPLSVAILGRLFPDAPEGDPSRALLWCTGRIDLPGRPRVTSWVLRTAVA